jgi:hypothetical protein
MLTEFLALLMSSDTSASTLCHQCPLTLSGPAQAAVLAALLSQTQTFDNRLRVICRNTGTAVPATAPAPIVRLSRTT